MGKRFTGGPILKRDFGTLAEAREWIGGNGRQHQAQRGTVLHLKKSAGSAAFELSANQIAEAASAGRALGTTGTITEAVTFFLRHARPSDGEHAIEDGVRELIRAKKGAGRSVRHLDGLEGNLLRFAASFPNVKLHEIHRSSIESWLSNTNLALTTRGNYIRDLSILFRFAFQRGWIAINPVESVEKPRDLSSEVRVLTPEDTTEFMREAESFPDIVAALAVKFFAGLRTSELFALDVDDIRDRQIIVSARNAKTRQRRIVSVVDNLQLWLSRYAPTGTKITSVRDNAWHRRLEHIVGNINDRRKTRFSASAIEFCLPANAARHSFCNDAARI